MNPKPVSANDVLSSLAERYAPHNSTTSPHVDAACENSRRSTARRKLWEFDGHAACPITGVCLRLPELQKMARKAGLDLVGKNEYEIHIALASQCRHRSELAEIVQRKLDARYDLFVLKSLRLKTTEALAQWWDQCCMGMDWAGVFWAVLTHPRCTPEFEFIVLGQVHMLQHQVGMAARIDQTRLLALIQENQKMGDELIHTQQRLKIATQASSQRKAQHNAELLALRTELIRAQTAQDHAEAELDALQRNLPELPQRQKLQDSNRRLLEDNQSLRRALNLAQTLCKLKAPCPLPADMERPAITHPSPPQTSASIHDHAVLCVGGRTGVVPVYRELVEDKGARFLHHDGGEEDTAGQLGPMLQSADLVICQVGCISHNAYWRVKEHCKRHDKPCLFVETPSRSALKRALSSFAEPIAVVPSDLHSDATVSTD